MAGIVNVAHADVVGAQFGLGANVVNGSMRGVQLALGGNFSESMPYGAQFTSLLNVTGKVGHGAQFSGVLNAVSGTAKSQFAGVANLAGEDALIQAAGAVNISGQSSFLQMAGAVNISGKSAFLQMAGAVNIADGPVWVQLAPVNVSTGPTGFQLGVVNVAAAGVAVPLGIINVIDGVPWRLSFRSDDQGMGQIALKTGNDYVYTLLGLTAPRLSAEDVPDFISGLGARLPLGRFLYLETDFLRVTSFDSVRDGHHLRVDHVEDQFRIQAGVKILPFLGISGGINFHAPQLIDSWRLMPAQSNFQLGLDLFLSPPSLREVGLDKLW